MSFTPEQRDQLRAQLERRGVANVRATALEYQGAFRQEIEAWLREKDVAAEDSETLRFERQLEAAREGVRWAKWAFWAAAASALVGLLGIAVAVFGLLK
jgi:hypothetical protein